MFVHPHAVLRGLVNAHAWMGDVRMPRCGRRRARLSSTYASKAAGFAATHAAVTFSLSTSAVTCRRCAAASFPAGTDGGVMAAKKASVGGRLLGPRKGTREEEVHKRVSDLLDARPRSCSQYRRDWCTPR